MNDIKLNSQGTVRENIGFTISQTGNRQKKKFSLGNDLKEAKRRYMRIEELWDHVRQQHQERFGNETVEGKPILPIWDETSLWIAEQLARGATVISVDCRKISPHEWGNHRVLEHAKTLNRLTQTYPFLRFQSDDEDAYQAGQGLLNDFVVREGERLKSDGFQPDSKPVVFSNVQGSLHEAMDAYTSWINKEYFNREEGHVSDTGETKKRQTKTLKHHISDTPLAAMDFTALDEMTKIFRKRPTSRRTGKMMEKKSCESYIKELWFFLKWLHKEPSYNWRLPTDWNLISHLVQEYDSDVEKEGAEIPVYTIEQLALLNKYATPLERLFLLLGINCAYGADQAGRLKLNHIQWNAERPYIKRIRRKKKVRSCHRLWKQTLEGLEWAKKNRPANLESDWAIVKKDGTGYWRKTKGGNRARDIAGIFQKLVERVRKDYKDFPKHAFNTVRDTSIDMVRQKFGEELASTHAAHVHQSSDKNLNRYSNPRIKALFKAHRILEAKLQKVFDAAPVHAFQPQKHAYISVGTNERINEMLRAGEKPATIASELEISPMTVYRRKKELGV